MAPSFIEACDGLENVVTNVHYGKTALHIGYGAINAMETILKEHNVKNLGVVSDPVSYKASGAWEKLLPIFEKVGVKYTVYDQVVANPTAKNCEEAIAKFTAAGVEAVLGIGGGSGIDCAKTVSLLLKDPGHKAEEYYIGGRVPVGVAPLFTINTTHGTGTEVNRFAVITFDTPEGPLKPYMAHPLLYPLASIDDPSLVESLPPKQTVFVSIDALNHVMEAISSTASPPFSIDVGRTVYEIVAHFLPIVMKDPHDKKGRYMLHYASAIAGMAFDSGLLHLTHALEHPLSAVKPDLAHGLGLSVIQPNVLKACFAAREKTFRYVMAPVIGEPKNAHEAGKNLEAWLASVGVGEKLSDIGFNKGNLDECIKSLNSTDALTSLFGITPIPVNPEVVMNIYLEALNKLE